MKYFVSLFIYFIYNFYECQTTSDDIFDELWKHVNKDAQKFKSESTVAKAKEEPIEIANNGGPTIKAEPCELPKNREKIVIKNEPYEYKMPNTKNDQQNERGNYVKKEEFIVEEPRYKEEDNRALKWENECFEKNSKKTDNTDDDYEMEDEVFSENDVDYENVYDEDSNKSANEMSTDSEQENRKPTKKRLSGIINKKSDTKHAKFLQGMSSTEEKVRLAQAKATKTKKLTDEEKKQITKKFVKLKDHFENEKMSKRMLEKEIANTFSVHESSIYHWKKKFGINGKTKIKRYSKEQKFNLVKQFDEMKSRMKDKSIAKTANEMDNQIAKELGVSRSRICQWKKDFGITKSNHYGDSEKIKIVKKYFEMIEQNPHLSKKDISEELNVPQRTLNRWISNLQ